MEYLEPRAMLSASTSTDADTAVVARIINGTVTSDWEAVGKIGSSDEGYYGSGVLIGSKYVLTAGHCGYGLADDEGIFYINGREYTTSDVIVYSGYNANAIGTDRANDIAIFVLSEEVTGVTPSAIYEGTPEVGEELTLVGYGYGGNGYTGSDYVYGTKREGTTDIEYVSTTLIGWTFDYGSSESNTAPGDSGSPAYVYENGAYYVAGICSCGTSTNAAYGDTSYDTRVDAYADWINSIIGDDTSSSLPTVSISATDDAAAEALSSETANTGQFTITLSEAAATDVTVYYTISGTATNGTDYDTIAASATIAAGSASTTVDVKPIDDSAAESTETVKLALASSAAYNVSSSLASATVSIADNEPTVSIVATDATAAETASGVTANTGLFTVTRTGSTAEALTVSYTIAGTATNGTDYTTIASTVTIAAGSSSATIEVVPTDDASYESTETVKLTLASSTAYNVSSSQKTATVSITDNDTKPTVVITATDATAAETFSGATADTGLLTVTRTGSTDAALTVKYVISGTATNGADYTTIASSVTIPAGSSSATIAIAPIDDSTYEATEKVAITLSSSSLYTLVSSQRTATVSITDNDTSTAPANDNFANRISMTTTTVTGSNVNATRESGEAYNAGVAGGKSVWWTWTATTSGQVTLSTLGSSFDTTLGVYTGSKVSSLKKVAANDDANYRGGVLTSQVSFYAVAGTTYQISVDGYRGASGTVQLSLAQSTRSTSAVQNAASWYAAPSSASTARNTAAADAVYRSLAQLATLY